MYSIKRFSQMAEQKEFNSKAQKALRATYDKMKALKDVDSKKITREIKDRAEFDPFIRGISKSKDSLTDRTLKSVGRSANRKGMLVRSEDLYEATSVPYTLNNKINEKGYLEAVKLSELKSAEELASKGGGKGALNKIKDHLSEADHYSSMINRLNRRRYVI